MNKYLTAFFMAWGNFLSIPCPVKRWDENLRKEMLKMLPSVGLVVGLIWFALAVLLWKIKLPYILSGFFLTAYIYFVTGFLHLDGFMDCRDAIMSRRDLAERQRILKDSHVGAFGVISVVLLILGMFAGLSAYMFIVSEITEKLDAGGSPYLWRYFLPLVVLPVVTRHWAGAEVIKRRPMETSQYVNTWKKSEKESSSIAPGVMVVQTLIYVLVPFAIMLLLDIKGGESLSENAGLSQYTAFGLFRTFAASIALAMIATNRGIKKAVKSLGGMNGDIAGYGICLGEVWGVIAATLCLPLLYIG